MTTTWRARDSRGHYLPSKDVHTTLGPEDWDDTCRHQQAAAELQPSAENFGHHPVPVSYLGNIFTEWSNCQSCHDEETEQVCARCVEFDGRRLFRIPTHPVHWPCTSAIVLGLADQPAA